MAKGIYRIENLDCANCAAKIERKFNDLPEVEEAVITFATGQLRLTAEDPDALIPRLVQLARTVEGEVEILPLDRGHHHAQECGHDHSCGCGHHHEEGHECHCGHHHEEGHECHCGHHHEEEEYEEEEGHSPKPFRLGNDLAVILIGAELFLAGLMFSLWDLTAASLVAFGLAWVVLGWDILLTAAKNLTKGHVLDENFLMSVASMGAFLIGESAEGVGVMLFYRIGEYFEEKAMERSRSQIMAAVDMRPETVTRLEGEFTHVIPAGEARVGDVLLVRPGDRIPLDGVVLSGESAIDTAPITGEPVPVQVQVGSSVISGCVNGNGPLTIRVEKGLEESMVTRILNSVENAAASKPKIDKFITRFARIYTPIVVGAAAVIAIVPSLVTGNWSYWVYTALSFLVMSCPCALVLSVPLAFFAGIGVGSRKGILFKGGVSMEAMQELKAVILDKTGTLTKGDFRVQKIAGGLDVLTLCASCEQQSTHPIAVSIAAAATEKGMVLARPEVLEEIPGRGIRAILNGRTILCGNAIMMAENRIDYITAPDPGTIVYVAENGTFAGYLVISDTVKPGAQEAVAALKNQGLTTIMLTGDHAQAAKAVATELGIQQVYAGLLPHQKLEKLQQLRRDYGAVMFVGDGINDAPVLAGANVGAAMGSGADAAIEAADVVFMTSDPGAIGESLAIARDTNRTAWQNVVFALAVKAVVMLLGLLGFASMWLAVFADSGVAMLCVLNSIRSLYRKK